MPSVQSHNILPSYRPDHATVILSFQVNDFKRGSGLWKFNNSLLRDISKRLYTIGKRAIHVIDL